MSFTKDLKKMFDDMGEELEEFEDELQRGRGRIEADASDALESFDAKWEEFKDRFDTDSFQYEQDYDELSEAEELDAEIQSDWQETKDWLARTWNELQMEWKELSS